MMKNRSNYRLVMYVNVFVILFQMHFVPLKGVNYATGPDPAEGPSELKYKRYTEGSEHPFMDGRSLKLEVMASNLSGVSGLVIEPDSGGVYLSDTGGGIVYYFDQADGLTAYINREITESSGKRLINVENPTGLEIDNSGKLIVCDQGAIGVRRRESKFRWKELAVSSEKHRLSGPTDIILASDGSYYFSDSRLFKENFENCGVYRRAKNGRVSLLYDGLTNPAGMAFSEKESHLFIANADPKNSAVFRFDVGKAGKLTNPVEWPMLYNGENYWKSKIPSVVRNIGGDCLVVAHDEILSFFHMDGKMLGSISMPEKIGSVALDGAKEYLWVGGKSKLFRITAEDLE